MTLYFNTYVNGVIIGRCDIRRDGSVTPDSPTATYEWTYVVTDADPESDYLGADETFHGTVEHNFTEGPAALIAKVMIEVSEKVKTPDWLLRRYGFPTESVVHLPEPEDG